MTMLLDLFTVPALGISNANVNGMGPGCIISTFTHAVLTGHHAISTHCMCTSPLSPVALSLPSPPQQAPINPRGESVVDL